jgi:hemoglobin-like flavoprotein
MMETMSDARPGTPSAPWLTERQQQLVRESFAHLEPVADAAASIFYFRLFDLDPSVRALFAADMTAQRRNLMQTLGTIVRGIDRLDLLGPSIAALGRRHAAYGVRPNDYETVEVALIDGMEETLGSIFDAETRAAWAAAYRYLSATMQGTAGDSASGASDSTSSAAP